jgi:natural product precursor
MKTLGKLKINSEKIINEKELQTLRGGSDCSCFCYNWDIELIGIVGPTSALYCNALCLEFFDHGFGHWDCN